MMLNVKERKALPFIFRSIALVIALAAVTVAILSCSAEDVPMTEPLTNGTASDSSLQQPASPPGPGAGSVTETTPSPQPPPEITHEPAPEQLPEETQTTDDAPITEPARQAEELTGMLTITISDGKRAGVLLDRDYTTKYSLSGDATIGISSPEDIYALYVIWDLPPGEWELTGDCAQTCGFDGFIHEYIQLSAPSSELTMNIPPDGARLCDIYAFTEGVPPDWVQIWSPPLYEADLLVLPTHADDEHLYFVGILPYYAGELGYSVQVAYMTNHWNQPPRPHELLNGLWVVGIRNYPVISSFRDRYADSLSQAKSIFGWAAVVDFQVELLRRFKPFVVVGHDVNGEYGHGAHMLNAAAIMTAVDCAADRTYHLDSYEKYGIWDTPKLYLHLYRENAITMDWSIPLENFGGATAYEMAVAGYACHLSQHNWSFRVPETGSVGHKFGLVRSLVGDDVIGGDLFENIDFSRNTANDNGILID